MKNNRWLALILCLTLAACNLPASSTPSPTTDVVATQVAVILTSQPTPEPATQEPVAPTEIVIPTNTLEPVPPTAEPSSTSTASPTDPREFLGNPTFVDTIDNGRSFGLDGKDYDDDNTYIRVENGALVLTSRYAVGYRGWRTGGTKIKDAYIEARVRVGECGGLDTYGLVFRSPDFVKANWFQVTCNGNWAFGYWDGEQYVELANGSDSTGAILTGSNQVNRLGVMASGSRYTLYVNGKLIDEVTNDKFIESGSYGMIISSRNTPNFTIYTEDFTYWTLNP